MKPNIIDAFTEEQLAEMDEFQIRHIAHAMVEQADLELLRVIKAAADKAYARQVVERHTKGKRDAPPSGR